MRNNKFVERRNVRNSKQALVESIMTKIRPVVEKALKNSAILENNTNASKKYTELNDEQISMLNDYLSEKSPETLYGGYVVKGKYLTWCTWTDEYTVASKGVLKILVAGDFDEDEIKPHWFECKLNGPVFERYESEDEDEDGNPYYDWDYASYQPSGMDYDIMEQILGVDVEWVYGQV